MMSNPLAVQYLSDNIMKKKKKFASFWTNKHLHFENRATSRDESSNGKLKKQLGGSSVGIDLQILIATVRLTPTR